MSVTKLFLSDNKYGIFFVSKRLVLQKTSAKRKPGLCVLHHHDAVAHLAVCGRNFIPMQISWIHHPPYSLYLLTRDLFQFHDLRGSKMGRYFRNSSDLTKFTMGIYYYSRRRITNILQKAAINPRLLQSILL
jgi:hypothetical protein